MKKIIWAINTLGVQVNDASKAGMLSLSFSSTNDLGKLANDVSNALITLDMKKAHYFGSTLTDLDHELTDKLAQNSNAMSPEDVGTFLKAWTLLLENHGHKTELQSVIGGHFIQTILRSDLSHLAQGSVQ